MNDPTDVRAMGNPARLEYLDSVRGMAALAVLIGHYHAGFGIPSFVPAWLWNTPFSIVRDGYAAVAMFFVLSGLVLSLKHVRAPAPFPRGTRDLAAFFIARIARILLPFLAVLWLSAALQLGLPRSVSTVPPPSTWLLSFWTAPQGIGQLLTQSFLFLPGIPANRLLPQDWTLTVELDLSLWTPFLILIAMNSISGLLFFSLVGIAFFQLHALVFPFALGIVLARLFARIQASAALRRPGIFLALLGSGLLLYSARSSRAWLPASWTSPFGEPSIWYVTEVGAAMILVALVGSPSLQRFLHLPPLTQLGRTSYSFYLWHFAVLRCFTPTFLSTINRWGLTEPSLAWGAGLAGTVMVTILVSELSFRLIETPSIDLGRRINRRLF